MIKHWIIASLLFLGWFAQAKAEQAVITYYANYFQGRKTSNGERYNKKLYTAAHASLPFGTKIEIYDEVSNKAVVVKINDRCKYFRGVMHFDLSYQAAKDLDILKRGKAKIQYRIVDNETMVGLSKSIPDFALNKPQNPNDNTKVVTQPAKQNPNSDKEFLVQVGAFNDIKNAEKRAITLRSKGFEDASVTENIYTKNAKYLVVVSGFATYQLAKKYVSKLKNNQFESLILEQ